MLDVRSHWKRESGACNTSVRYKFVHAEDKSVRVPVRQRSRQTRSGRAEKHLTFLLPETPLDERFVQESDQVGGPVVRTPGEKGRLGVFSPGRDGQVFTPGVASTPIAVEVLSSLYSINNNQKVNINKHQAQKKEVCWCLCMCGVCMICT